MMSILPIVVLYNVDFHETTVYKSLLQHCPGLRICLYENSPKPSNRHYADETVIYHHDPENGGVSAAYNYGAAEARRMGNIEAILLLDEDTRFEADYLSVLQSALQKHPEVNLFVPQILYAGDQAFSPIHRGTLRHRWTCLQMGVYSLHDYLPVNSGACIRLSAFEQTGGYNTAIRLDFADFDFFSRLAEVSDVFSLVDSTAFQAFSNEERQTGRLFRRYQFYVEGARAARRNPLIRKMVAVETWRHTLALTARTRSLKFIRYLILQHS